MLEKGRFSKNLRKFLLVLAVFFSTKTAVAENLEKKVISYNSNLKNSSANFIQTDGETVEEGVVFIGPSRIRFDYKNPENISIVLSEKRGMYVNHELREAQFFSTNKTIVGIFFQILSSDSFLKTSDIVEFKETITITNNFNFDDVYFKTNIIYESDPLKLRKIKFREDNRNIEIGFFDHKKFEEKKNRFFALINPFILN